MPFLPGDIVLYEGRGLTGWTIRRVTRSRAAHVAIVAPDGFHLIEAAGPRRGVVRTRPPRDRVVLVIPAPDDTTGRRSASFAATRVGARYNLSAYLILLVRLLVHRSLPGEARVRRFGRRSFTCSALVTCAWRQAGVDLAPGIAADLVTPGDILRAAVRNCATAPGAGVTL